MYSLVTTEKLNQVATLISKHDNANKNIHTTHTPQDYISYYKNKLMLYHPKTRRFAAS